MVEVGQCAGDDAVVARAFLQLQQITFKHFYCLVVIPLLTDVGRLVEDVVLAVLWCYLDNQLPIVLCLLDVFCEIVRILSHLRAVEVQFTLLVVIGYFLFVVQRVRVYLAQQVMHSAKESRNRENVCHANSAGGKALMVGCATQCRHVLINIIVGRVKPIGHVFVIQSYVEVVGLFWCQRDVPHALFDAIDALLLFCRQLVVAADEAVKRLV